MIGGKIGLEPPIEAGAVSGWHGLGDFARDAVLQMDGGQCRDPATNLQVGKYTLVVAYRLRKSTARAPAHQALHWQSEGQSPAMI